MKLQNNLYSISSAESSSFRVDLNPECLIFKAHFPEQPITPGVCIIQIACELLNNLLEKDVTLVEVINAKFLSVINPLETPHVTYTFAKTAIDEETAKLKTQVIVTSDTTTCAKLSLLFTIND